MKQKYLLPFATVFICSALILPGCIKSNEYLQHLDDIGKFCKIRTMTYTYGPNGPYIASFHYNSFGDPDSIVYPPNPDLANLYFRYDNHHRLLDYIYAFPGGNNNFFWFRYFYANERSESPYIDSLYMFPPQISHWPPGGNGPAFDYYVYDSLKRLTVWVGEGLDSIYFNYDAHGNLIPMGQHVFSGDDKVNFLRTSRVLQFIGHDYSVNNPFVGNKYNRYGLPTETGNAGAIQLFWGVLDYSTAKIEYECK